MPDKPDIIDRLRWCRWRRPDGSYGSTYDLSGIEAERLDAADEIEFLRKVIANFQPIRTTCQTAPPAP